MTWLRKHWLLVVAVLLVTHGVAFYAGRRSVPQQTVQLSQTDNKTKVRNSDTDTRRQDGPLDATITVGGQPCATASAPRGRPARTVPEMIADLPAGSVITFHQGASTEETRAISQTVSAETLRTDLRVAPANLPRWAVGAGLEDPLGARSVQVTAGMRLLGPIWLRAAFTPARGLPGATLGAEVQW